LPHATDQKNKSFLVLFFKKEPLASFLRCKQRSASFVPPRLFRAPARNTHADNQGRLQIMIHVLAIITTKPGKRAEVLAAMAQNIPAVRAEAGCIEYGPVVDAEGLGNATFGPDTFVVVEKWESPEALSAHGQAPHMAAYAAKVADLLAERAIHVLRPA
jgi:quinol monooxygenase YgiN